MSIYCMANLFAYFTERFSFQGSMQGSFTKVE